MDPRIGPLAVIVLFLLFLFFVVVVGLIIFAFFRKGMHNHMWHSQMWRDPLDIAKERYAKGEIDEKELNKIKKNLS